MDPFATTPPSPPNIARALLGQPATREERWSVDGAFPYGACPAVDADGTAFVGSIQGDVWALDAHDGHKIWTTHTGLIGGTPVLGHGRVYAAAIDGHVQSLDPSTGEVKWRRKTEAHFVDELDQAGDVLLARSQEGRLYAIDALNGDPLWDVPCNPPVALGPVGSPAGMAIVPCWKDRTVRALHARDGREMWQHDVAGKAHSLACAADGTVYVSWNALVDDGVLSLWTPMLTSLDAQGQVRWETALAPNPGFEQMKLGANPSDTVVMTSNKGTVIAVDAANGVEQWREALGMYGEGSVSVPVTGPDQQIYVTAFMRGVQGRDAHGASTLDVHAKVSTQSPPGIGPDGAIVVTDDAGVVHGVHRVRRTAEEVVAESAQTPTREPGTVEVGDHWIVIDHVRVPRRT